MADDIVSWQAENIPDSDHVYMRAHRQYFRRKMLQPGAFRPRDGGMSVDWEKYSSPEDTRQRASSPQENAVIRLPVIGIRKISNLDVKHTPESANRSHSDVIGIPEHGEDQTEAERCF